MHSGKRRWLPTWLLVLLSLPAAWAAEKPPVTVEGFDAAFSALVEAKGELPERERLQRLFALQWRLMLWNNPEMATYTGYPEFNENWTDLSRVAIDRRKREVVRTRAALKSVDVAGLDADSRLHLELFDKYLGLDEEALRFPEEYLLLNQLQGPQQDLARMFSLMNAGTPGTAEAIQARLEKVPEHVDQVISLLREGLSKGITPPGIVLRAVPEQMLNLLPADPEKSPFFQPLGQLPEPMPAEERRRVRSAATAAITNAVYPAMRRLHRFLVDEYIPGARTGIACSELPDGRAWYAHRVRRSTTTSLTPEAIHEIGLAEVRRIRAGMERIREEVGFKGDLGAFFEHLRTDPGFFHETGTALLAGYRDISKRIDGGLPRLFGRLPRLPYGVVAIPSYSERSQTTAYYQPGSLQAGRPGNFFANTYNLRMRPKWEMEALTLHEAVPGHHLQIALGQENESSPEFQKHAETTAFVEGWALYAESLGKELGLYQDPYSRFGQLTYEMWRAIRLVVDTGIHSKGWTRDEAIEFFRLNAGKTEHDIVVEVDRYIVWPGQALAYKIGELKIRELRRSAEEALGSRFDLRSFHDEVLGRGGLPLDVLERLVGAWVVEQKKRGSNGPR